MSYWGELLTRFARGAAEGAIEGFFDRMSSARAHLTYEDDSFGDRMRYLAQETPGVSLASLEPTRATFTIYVDNDRYTIFVSWRGEKFLVGICSLIKFAPGGAPADVVRFLAERNKETPNYDYGLVDDEDEAFFFVHSGCRVSALDARTFAAGIADLAGAISGLDSFLLKNGYARER